MEKKKYSISELARILDVTQPAIRKKIKQNGKVKRYKNRFEVVEETINSKPTMLILLDDEELQEEISASKTNKNKIFGNTTVDDTYTEDIENVDYIDVTPEKPSAQETFLNNIYEFTERYINRSENVYKMLLEEKDRSIKMLEILDNNKVDEVMQAKSQQQAAEQKLADIQKETDKKIKRYQYVLLTLLITFFITVITFTVFYIKALNKPPQVIETEKVVTVEKLVPVKGKR